MGKEEGGGEYWSLLIVFFFEFFEKGFVVLCGVMVCVDCGLFVVD